jgi:hypothetical protein
MTTRIAMPRTFACVLPIGRRLALVLLVFLVGGLSELAAVAALADDFESQDYRHRLHRRPRHPRYHRAPRHDHENFVHLKLGTFDPEGDGNGGGFFGFSTGVELQNRITAGFTADFYRRSFTDEVIIAETVDENGNVITTSVRRLDTSSNLIPLGVALGFRLPGSRTVTPFAGVGVAYEFLINDVENYELGVEDTNVYSGPGWQLFGGLLVPVTSDVRLLGELWMNDATVSRDIDRYERGLPVTERIDVDGFGARAGIEFHFD